MYTKREVMKTLDERYMTEYVIQAQRAEMTELIKVIKDLSRRFGKKLRILDIGIGDARIPRVLSGIKEIWDSVAEYDGIDNSKEMLERAKFTITQHSLDDKVELFELDAKNLSQFNKSYELIICTYFTAGDFYPDNFSFEIDEDGKLKRSLDLEKNESFQQVFRSAFNSLITDGKIVLGSVYVDNESTRKKQEEFYKKCGMTVISRPTDSFTATEEGFWSQRFTEKKLINYFDFVRPENIGLIDLDTYNFAQMIVVSRK